MSRVLCFGLDGADHALVVDLLADGKLPTISRLAREGAFGPLRSTIPAVTPTAWSSFLTGLNPAGHGIFNFATNPNRAPQRVESAASRTGTPLWRTIGAAGKRSAFVEVPFTYPPEPIDGVLVTGYGGPITPEIVPSKAREKILGAHPGLVTAHHPKAERWWEDFDGFTRKLLDHVDQLADTCALVLDLEPDLSLLAVDFMSSDFAGHLAWNRLDETHPAHDPANAGDELVQVYEAIDRACGELAQRAELAWGEEPTVLIMSDHGMKPIHWVFHANRWLEEMGLLKYRRRSLQPLKGGRLDVLAKVDQRLARTTTWYGRTLDALPVTRPADDRTFADVDFGRTRAYCFGTGGQIYLGEATGAWKDTRLTDEIAKAVGDIRHPETGEPAFEVRRKEEIYRGTHLDRAPELVILSHDERIHVDSSRRAWSQAFDRHDRLDPEHFYGYSGHHGLNGILAAAGPGIRVADVPAGSEITQVPATLLALLGIASTGLDGEPIEAILEDAEPRETVSASPEARDEGSSVYSADEEARMLERLRDLGYE
ncbi:MAG TPA: alkaline phosphatase family protein [Gaiellaceae bacterium]